jgi:prevent-host-death family protein
MREIGAYEAKTHLSELLAAVERGEEVRITRRGRPIARLVPDGARAGRAAALRDLEALRTGMRGRGGAPLGTEGILAARDAGRR